MDKLFLTKSTLEFAEDIMAYRQEFLEAGDSMDGTSGCCRFEDPAEWLSWLDDLSREETCPDNLVPATLFLCVEATSQRIVGMVDIRHRLNETLLNFGGNIGYSIRPSQRRKGYGTQQLRLALDQCVKMGFDRVLVTCDRENIASAKIIQHCGGILENEVFDPSDNTMTQRYWISL